MNNLKTVLSFILSAFFFGSLCAEAKVRIPKISNLRVQVERMTIPRKISSIGIGSSLGSTIRLPSPASLQPLMAARYGQAQSLDRLRNYERHLSEFVSITKELNIQLGYQQLESRRLGAEQYLYEDLLSKAAESVKGMEKELGPADPALQAANGWLREVFAVLLPDQARFLFKMDAELLSRDLAPGRVFDEKEFLLNKGKDGKPLIDKVWTHEEIEEARRLAGELPSGLSVAVLNDVPEMRRLIGNAAARGFLGKDARVEVFESMDALTEAWDNLKRYDVVLLDYVLEDGISLYVVNKIRGMEDLKTVLFITCELPESSLSAQDLFQQGLDGFISSVGFDAGNAGPRLTYALHHYFSYKNKYGWAR